MAESPRHDVEKHAVQAASAVVVAPASNLIFLITRQANQLLYLSMTGPRALTGSANPPKQAERLRSKLPPIVLDIPGRMALSTRLDLEKCAVQADVVAPVSNPTMPIISEGAAL